MSYDFHLWACLLTCHKQSQWGIQQEVEVALVSRSCSYPFIFHKTPGWLGSCPLSHIHTMLQHPHMYPATLMPCYSTHQYALPYLHSSAHPHDWLHLSQQPLHGHSQAATHSLHPLALAHGWPAWKLPKESLLVTRAFNFLLVSLLTLLIRSWQEVENDSTMSSTLTILILWWQWKLLQLLSLSDTIMWHHALQPLY